jgi:2-oxoglutarate dehydrogenase E2 component (dihydrolipoamide succinyltransferase)
VRKIASEHGVDIAQLDGSGISGRVTKTDILSYIEGRGTTAQQARSLPGAPVSLPGGAIPDAYRARILEGDRVEDLTAMRSKIAEHMVWSRRISAHVQSIFEIDYTRVSKLRAQYNDVWQERHGLKLTYTHFIMKAVVDALKQWPVLNASLDEQKVIYHRDVNLGMAVALDWGLIVPVIHKANELNLLGLARRVVDLGERARTKKLKPEDVQGGTFTITNPGQFGNVFGIPIINQPQVAIAGVGGIEKKPVVIDDAIAIRTRGFVTLSFDHRLVDGAAADQFMALVKRNIQEFDESEL